MSTRSLIDVKNKDNTHTDIHCHKDGFRLEAVLESIVEQMRVANRMTLAGMDSTARVRFKLLTEAQASPEHDPDGTDRTRTGGDLEAVLESIVEQMRVANRMTRASMDDTARVRFKLLTEAAQDAAA